MGTVERVIVELNNKGMKKGHKLLVVGGGYLQDIGTLAAALYMRGVKWSYAPSTLAAMGDSCVGGKSSINAGGVKNLVGNFYPPSKIYIDIDLCKTLPEIEILAGISEIVKICFAKDTKVFNHVYDLIEDWYNSRDSKVLEEIVYQSLVSKKYFVEEDEFDNGIRKLLNFGHSFGHALEASLNFEISHGIAVMVGMIAASKHEKAKPGFETEKLVRFCLFYLNQFSEILSIKLSEFNRDEFSSSILKDKKNTNDGLVLILPVQDKLEIVEVPFKDFGLEFAIKAIDSALESLTNEVL